MKKKIVGILVMTLLITTGTIVVADWDEDDGHKMHYPQLPDPNGWDVDWDSWFLGDDWTCSKDGNVRDIHFWYSWFKDKEYNITKIDVQIWSNDPGPPSMPKEELWSRTFYRNEFVIAGPWHGEQGWYMPYPHWWEKPNHEKYWQINIMDISEPFKQENGTTYWLLIRMPGSDFGMIGWKTSISKQYQDAAVFSWEGDWFPIYAPITQEKLDLAFVITGAKGLAKDIHDGESSREYLRITVPRDKVIMSSFFYHLLEQFPILRLLFQRLGLQ